MSENKQVTETTTDVTETEGVNKKALVAAGVTILVAAAVGVVLKVRASRTGSTEVEVDGETYEVPTERPTKKTKES